MNAEQFLKIASEFQLGALPTEQIHPKSVGLSDWAKTDPKKAARILNEIDRDALSVLETRAPEIEELQREIQDTFHHGGRVFLCGCGATGRLSLTLEVLFREMNPDSNSVIGFMAGGDYALIKSIESFEDHPEYGQRQLLDLGFSSNDLLISTTEGGETPFVIGATEAATEVSKRKPYFLYCNPDDVLSKHVERSRRVIQNGEIKKINLTVGPMAVSGSTRLQATTVLMMAVGMALLSEKENCFQSLIELRALLQSPILESMSQFAVLESAAYFEGASVLYETDEYAITLLTDTTERSPTFSLNAIENRLDSHPVAALSSITVLDAHDSRSAWARILRRAPRVLNWDGFREQYGERVLNGFDLSREGISFREGLTQGKNDRLRITRTRSGFHWGYSSSFLPSRGHSQAVEFPRVSLLAEHMFLKLLLNSHSIITMGRMGRFESNVMLYVRPTNYKLIDRATRYVRAILEKRGMSPVSYEEIVRALFRVSGRIQSDQSTVLQTVEELAC